MDDEAVTLPFTACCFLLPPANTAAKDEVDQSAPKDSYLLVAKRLLDPEASPVRLSQGVALIERHFLVHEVSDRGVILGIAEEKVAAGVSRINRQDLGECRPYRVKETRLLTVVRLKVKRIRSCR